MTGLDLSNMLVPELRSCLFLWSCLRHKFFLRHSSYLLVYHLLLRNVLISRHPSILLTVTYAVTFSTCYPLWYRHWMAAICPVGRLILPPARLRSFSVDWTDAGKTYLEGNNHINFYLQTWLALHSKCLSFTSSEAILGGFLKEVVLIPGVKTEDCGKLPCQGDNGRLLRTLFWKQGRDPFVGQNWGRCGWGTWRIRSD